MSFSSTIAPPLSTEQKASSSSSLAPSASLEMDSSGTTRPAWLQTCPPPSAALFPPLAGDAETEVIIIGAGIAGLQVAYELNTRGVPVMVIEDGAVASGETGRTSAHLTNAFDDHYSQLLKYFSKDKVQMVADSHTWAISRIEQICTKEGIECEFERLNAHLIHGLQPHEKGFDEQPLLNEYHAAVSLGLPMKMQEQSSALPNFRTGTSIVFEQQAQFQPLKYMTQLANRLAERGVRIHCGTHAKVIKGGKEAHVKVASGHTIKAKHIVEATNIPISNKIAIIDKCMAHRTYCVALTIPRDVGGERALIYDLAEPYHYVRRARVSEKFDLLITGGEDHLVGHECDLASMEARFQRLEEWTRARFPEAQQRVYQWSGQVIDPVDFVGLIGRNDGDYDNVYVVTGDSGNGLTHGTIAGKLLADLITGQANPWAELYNPRRIAKSLSALAKHNATVGATYLRWVQKSDVRDIEDIGPCQGAVISCRLPPSHVAVYRDNAGKLHKMSAVCPHAYAIVHWNPLEHSWDCPAHGSRFDAMGGVINGPACSNLKPLDDAS